MGKKASKKDDFFSEVKKFGKDAGRELSKITKPSKARKDFFNDVAKIANTVRSDAAAVGNAVRDDVRFIVKESNKTVRELGDNVEGAATGLAMPLVIGGVVVVGLLFMKK